MKCLPLRSVKNLTFWLLTVWRYLKRRSTVFPTFVAYFGGKTLPKWKYAEASNMGTGAEVEIRIIISSLANRTSDCPNDLMKPFVVICSSLPIVCILYLVARRHPYSFGCLLFVIWFKHFRISFIILRKTIGQVRLAYGKLRKSSEEKWSAP